MIRPEPPWSEEAELSVLGAMLINVDAITIARELLDDSAFYREGNRLIFRAMGRLCGRGKIVDAVTLSDELKTAGQLDDAGGMTYLAQLVDAVPTADNIEHHCRMLIEKKTRRKIIEGAGKLVRATENGSQPALIREQLLELASVGDGLGGGSKMERLSRSLSELRQNPENLKSPEPLTRLAYRGRTTLLVGREKGGKSTTSRAASSHVSAGRAFLGEHLRAGRVLYAAFEEHVADVVRGFEDFGAAPDDVFLLERIDTAPLETLRREVAHIKPDLIVIDTLSAYAKSLGLESSDSTGWTQAMAGLTQLARDSKAAVLILHHAKKSDGRYRDSTAIGAGVDAILTMFSDDTDSSVRRIKGLARWPFRDFAIRLIGESGASDDPLRFELAEGELSLDARVLLDVQRNPGTTTNGVIGRVVGQTKRIKEALDRFEAESTIVNRKNGQANAWFALNQVTPEEAVLGEPVSREDPQGNKPEAVYGNAGVGARFPFAPLGA